MRAVVHDRYGSPDVLRLDDVERPTPTDDEVLVRVHATTVSRTDCGLRAGRPFFIRLFTGVRRPKRRITGIELAGVVEAVGAAVTEFRAGDEVFGIKGGANAEFVCVKQSGALVHKPTELSFEEAAAICDGAITALAGLRKADLRKGQRILVYGASGSIGTSAVQLARYVGAHVTAVCNTRNVDLVRSLGADTVIDYTREDFTRNGKTYDFIFDAVGKRTFWRCRRALKPGGVYLPTGGWWNMPAVLLTRVIGKRKATFLAAKYTKENVLYVKHLIEAGEYRAVIDRAYPLEQVVEATEYVETEQKTGNVVLTLGGQADAPE